MEDFLRGSLLPSEHQPILGTDSGLMIRAFAAALEDEHLLVKRGVLDLLDQSFRTDGAAFKG